MAATRNDPFQLKPVAQCYTGSDSLTNHNVAMAWRNPTTRSPSWAVPTTRSHVEQEALLANPDEEQHADSDGLYPPNSSWTSDNPNPPNPHARLPVYRTIHQYAEFLLKSA